MLTSSLSAFSHLAQNPFICDCNLKWLADYLRSNPIETSGARCASPRRLANKRIGQIKSKKFRCSGRTKAPPPRRRKPFSSSSLQLFASQTGRAESLFSLTFSLFSPWGAAFYLSIAPSSSYHV